MQIEKKYCYSTLPAFPVVSRGTTVAEEHAAFFPTQLALARWTRGGDVPHVYVAEHPMSMPMRAAWYMQAQQDFQAWLEAGGFHQAHPCSLDGLPAVSTPCAADGRAARRRRAPGAARNAPEGQQ